MARITYIDWNEDQSGAIQKELGQEGHEVRVVSGSADKAWRVIREEPADVFVIAANSNFDRALEAASATKTERLKDVPLVFLMGDARVANRDRIEKMYPDAVVTRPEDTALAVRQTLARAPVPE